MGSFVPLQRDTYVGVNKHIKSGESCRESGIPTSFYALPSNQGQHLLLWCSIVQYHCDRFTETDKQMYFTRYMTNKRTFNGKWLICNSVSTMEILTPTCKQSPGIRTERWSRWSGSCDHCRRCFWQERIRSSGGSNKYKLLYALCGLLNSSVHQSKQGLFVDFFTRDVTTNQKSHSHVTHKVQCNFYLTEFVIMVIKSRYMHWTVGVAFCLTNVVSACPHTTNTLTGIAIFTHFFALLVALPPVNTRTLFLRDALARAFIQDVSCR